MAPYQKLVGPKVRRDHPIIQRSISTRVVGSCLISAFSGDNLASCFIGDGITTRPTFATVSPKFAELDTCPNRSSSMIDELHCARCSLVAADCLCSLIFCSLPPQILR